MCKQALCIPEIEGICCKKGLIVFIHLFLLYDNYNTHTSNMKFQGILGIFA